MKLEEMNKILESVGEVEAVSPRLVEQRMRRALLSYVDTHSSNFFSFLKRGFKNMVLVQNKHSFALGVLAAFVLMGTVYAGNNSVLLAEYNPFATREAKAQAALKDVVFKARRLSADEQKEISKKMQADLQESLKEAQEAKDLIYIDPKDLGVGGGHGILHKAPIAGEAHKGVMVKFNNVSGEGGDPFGDIVKALRYTNAKGQQVTLGINAQDLPVMKMVLLNEKDMVNLRPMEDGKGVGFPPTDTFFQKRIDVEEGVKVNGEAGEVTQEFHISE